jgi:hypothetical protein
MGIKGKNNILEFKLNFRYTIIACLFPRDPCLPAFFGIFHHPILYVDQDATIGYRCILVIGARQFALVAGGAFLPFFCIYAVESLFTRGGFA